MADYINLQQSEFDEVQTKIENLHALLFAAENGIRESTLTLVSEEGGFYIAGISEKIKCLLDEVKAGPVAHLEKSFMGTEDAVESFVRAVKETDTCM